MEITGTSSGAASTATRSGSGLADYQQFLKLFVSQLKYQDPLSPLGGDDFLAQTAQFSTVEQLVSLNKQAQESADEMGLLGRSTAASLIGRTVEASVADAANSSAMVQGRVVQVEYGSDGGIVLGLEDGSMVSFADILSVSET